MGYVYRGTGEDILTPDLEDSPAMTRKKYRPRDYYRQQEKKKGPKKDTVHRDICGTNRGYQKHKNENEIADQACKDAHNEYNKSRPSYPHGKKNDAADLLRQPTDTTGEGN